MNSQVTAIVILIIVIMLVGIFLGYNMVPRSKYGYARNPYRRRCGECGQQQEYINYVGEPYAWGYWERVGHVHSAGCGCHDDLVADRPVGVNPPPPSERPPNPNKKSLIERLAAMTPEEITRADWRIVFAGMKKLIDEIEKDGCYRSWFRPYMAIAEERGKEPVCRHCAGAGSIRVFDSSQGPDGDMHETNCPHCAGTGVPPPGGDGDFKWRNLAMQFDDHRMRALAHLRLMVQAPAAHAGQAEAFLKAPPIPGEKVLADRIAAIAKGEAS